MSEPMTPKALEPVEQVALNIEAAHKWLSDGQAPRRTEVERCLCINKALAHLEIARAALEAAQPLPDIEKVAKAMIDTGINIGCSTWPDDQFDTARELAQAAIEAMKVNDG